jgi:RNA recognition motif-containing protein
MQRKLFIGNINFTTSEETLREAFEEHGELEEFKVITNRETGRSRGFGFATYATQEQAEKAVTALNNAEIDGRNLRVNIAENRPRKTRNFSRSNDRDRDRDRR